MSKKVDFFVENPGLVMDFEEKTEFFSKKTGLYTFIFSE